MNVGNKAYELVCELFPICRSITGNGVRQTLEVIKRELPELTLHEVPSGTKVFDWKVPKEWNINNAYIETLDGRKIIDFKNTTIS